MYINKYTPEEKLERIKLFMKYDSSKTLNENKSIIEQVDPSGDIRDIRDEIKSFNSNEQGIVDTIKKYTNMSDFNKLLSSYKEKYGKDLGDDLGMTLSPYNDQKEWTDLKNHLATFGVELGTERYNRGNDVRVTLKMGSSETKKSEKESTQMDLAKRRQEHINNMWCSLKNGVITAGGDYSGKKWEDYTKSIGNISDKEIEVAKKSCSKSNKNRGNKKTIVTPDELKTKEGIQHFQDWLDKYHPGWAWGYTEGIIAKGKNGGGYGTFGPRTSAAWSKHKKAYLSGEPVDNKNTKVADTGVDVSIDPVNIVEV